MTKFPPISYCTTTNRSTHTIAADLDGTLLLSRILSLYKLISESTATQLLVYVSTAGIPLRDIETVSKTILPRFYVEDMRDDSWRVFKGCGRRRVVVTANPTVMVQAFVKEWLGGDLVLVTELEVDGRGGRATSWVREPGVLVGRWKREAVVREFGVVGG